MPIQVKLFGDLRKKTQQQISGSSSLKLSINNSNLNRVKDILKKFSIEEDEVSHIFVNGRYSGFKKNVKNGDIISMFPKNMGLLYKWYFNREEDE
ncbi:hypothetical protein LCGC14_1110200 [marine sediment metagenome]|uniref:Ubiquitin Mut7-C domain-containing protein n=1 Tax=marine sediment metagenome TaxID=412755 RepID=A0A0F9QD35_9ZZZZ